MSVLRPCIRPYVPRAIVYDPDYHRDQEKERIAENNIGDTIPADLFQRVVAGPLEWDRKTGQGWVIVKISSNAREPIYRLGILVAGQGCYRMVYLGAQERRLMRTSFFDIFPFKNTQNLIPRGIPVQPICEHDEEQEKVEPTPRLVKKVSWKETVTFRDKDEQHNDLAPEEVYRIVSSQPAFDITRYTIIDRKTRCLSKKAIEFKLEFWGLSKEEISARYEKYSRDESIPFAALNRAYHVVMEARGYS